jgi:hypothetical protein
MHTEHGFTEATAISSKSASRLRKRHIYAVFAFGVLAGSITLIVTSSVAIMGVGGVCATGGAYEVSVPCPNSSAALLPVGFLGLITAGLAHIWFGRGPGPKPIVLTLPALLLALGGAFAHSAVSNLGRVHTTASLITAFVFGLLGGLPLWGGLRNVVARTWLTGRVSDESVDARRARRLLSLAYSCFSVVTVAGVVALTV